MKAVFESKLKGAAVRSLDRGAWTAAHGARKRPAARHGGVPLALAIIALTPAICEEAAFRGVVLKGLSRTGSRAVAVVGSALLFEVLHVHPAHIIIAAVLGLLFSHATLQTRSLLAGALLHFINNAASVLVARTNPEMTLENLGWMGSWIVSLVLLVPGVAALWLLRGPAPLPGGEPRLESAPA